MTAYPAYASTPKNGALTTSTISTANTNRDGTGTIGVVYTAGASGARIDGLVIQASGTTTAGMVRLYIYDATNTRLFHEEVVTAVTPGASTPAFSVTLNSANCPKFPLVLQATYVLKASTHNAETFNIVPIFAGDL